MKTLANNSMLVLIGCALGCGAAAVGSTSRADAQLRPGDWGCYAVDELPDPGEAASERISQKISAGLNAVARHSPPGTVVPLQWRPDKIVLCVKY